VEQKKNDRAVPQIARLSKELLDKFGSSEEKEMNLKSKKAATNQTSGKSVTTPGESSGPNAHDSGGAGTVPATGIETDRCMTAKAKTKSFSSTDLTAPKSGPVIQGLDHIGRKVYAELVKIAPDFDRQLEKLENANDLQLKKEFDAYKEKDYVLGEGITTMLKNRRQLFRQHIGLFWTIHECIVSPGFRSDLNGGKERTADYNFKMWGASTWQEFVERYSPYGLDATDKHVKEFGSEYGRLLTDGAAGGTETGTVQKERKVGAAGAKKERRSTVLDAANEKLASEYKKICNFALNSKATDGQIAATLKSNAQETFNNLNAAETKALRMPTILDPKQSELEILGIALAKRVWASTLLPADSQEKRDAHQVLLMAGVAATITSALATGQTGPEIGAVMDDRTAERIMTLVAQKKDVEPERIAKYEMWLAFKGNTERATGLRQELGSWKDAMERKALDVVQSKPPTQTTVDPAASGAA
jgi:hypothetical protein